jgi:hypothetical protein
MHPPKSNDIPDAALQAKVANTIIDNALQIFDQD